MPTLHILPDGTLQFIYQDELNPLLGLGETRIARASTVDPKLEAGQLNWYADLALSGGPLLGPFAQRDQAIEAEVAWLK